MIRNGIAATIFSLQFLQSFAASIPNTVSLFPGDKLNTSLSINASNNFFGLAAPTPPADFSTNVWFDDRVPLKVLDTYENCMRLMGLLAAYGWNAKITKAMLVSDRALRDEISVHPYPGDKPLDISLAITGLYNIGATIVERKTFFKLNAELIVKDVTHGILRMYPKEGELLSNDTTLRLNNIAASDLDTTPLSNPTRRSVTDPKDARLVVTYILKGTKINSKDIFVSFLNAFATSSTHANSDPGAYISTAPNSYDGNHGSGDVILSTWNLIGKDDERINWGRLKRVLMLIWTNVVLGQNENGRPRFEEFEFEMEFERVKIAGGTLIKLDEVRDAGGSGTAVQR